MQHAIENVLLFPGQGAHRDDELPTLASRHRQVRDVFDEIDAVAADLGAQAPGPQLFGADPPSLETLVATSPDVLQLAVYGTTLALSRIVDDAGQRTFALAGHSSGEIAALVAGGAYTLAQGAEIVIRRSALLRGLDGAGGMVALGCDAERAWQVLGAVADPWTVVAVENGERQTLVSGRHDALATVTAVARALRISVIELKAAYPFHGPLLAPLVAEFAAQIRHLRPRPLTALVYSPILGRFHRQDDALADHIAASLVAPVHFGSALRRLYDAGARSFVDCSLAGGLGRLTARCLPEATSVSALDALATAGVQPPARPAPVAAVPSQPAAPAPVPVATPQPVAALPAVGGPASRDELFAELAAMYAGALEYPAEVFTEDVALEADLGIDSVKQSELMARAADHYGVPERSEDFRLGDHDTMGKLVDYLWSTRGAPAPAYADARVAA
jgi:[acyl-carrier-protein] S-malonyltransferase